MKTAAIVLGSLIGSASMVHGAFAQVGLATSGGVHGANTIQQAPSGGRVSHGAMNTTAPGTEAQGEPTREEQQTEKHNNDVTQIRKGC